MEDDYSVIDYEDCINTTDPTGRYIHEPKWVEYLLESGLVPLFTTERRRGTLISWYAVEILEGRWPDTLDEGTTHVGYSHCDDGPLGHYYGWLAVGDPRHGGEVSCCTQLEQGTELGLVECDLDGTRFIGTVISKDVEGGNTYYKVEVDYQHSVSTKEEIDVHRGQNVPEGVIGVNAYEAKAINTLPSELMLTEARKKLDLTEAREMAERFLCFARMARVGDHMAAATEITNEIDIDFSYCRFSQVHCAICREAFVHDDKVFEIRSGTWEQEAPSFVFEDDMQHVAWVHPACLKRTT